MPNTTNATGLIFDNMRFPESVLTAAKNFAKEKPYRGSEAEKLEKFRACAIELRAALGITFDVVVELDPSAADAHILENKVVLNKFSVVSLFHLVKRLQGRGCAALVAQKFALNLFKRAFPRSFASASCDGFMLRKAE